MNRYSLIGKFWYGAYPNYDESMALLERARRTRLYRRRMETIDVTRQHLYRLLFRTEERLTAIAQGWT